MVSHVSRSRFHLPPVQANQNEEEEDDDDGNEPTVSIHIHWHSWTSAFESKFNAKQQIH